MEASGRYLATVGPLFLLRTVTFACPLLWAGVLPPRCPGSSWTEALSRGDLSWLACGCFILADRGSSHPETPTPTPHFPLSETVPDGRNHHVGSCDSALVTSPLGA